MNRFKDNLIYFHYDRELDAAERALLTSCWAPDPILEDLVRVFLEFISDAEAEVKGYKEEVTAADKEIAELRKAVRKLDEEIDTLYEDAEERESVDAYKALQDRVLELLTANEELHEELMELKDGD